MYTHHTSIKPNNKPYKRNKIIVDDYDLEHISKLFTVKGQFIGS